jgi:SAM-dependent methyltransferase
MEGKRNQKVDLLIFSFGSISHLSDDGQPETFLKEVAKILRPGSGRAYISIFDQSLLKKKDEKAFHQPGGVSELPSPTYPGVFYREANHRGELKGNVKYVKFDMQAIHHKDGKEEIIESNTVSMKMRQWEADELATMSDGTGLTLVEKVRGNNETFYVFKV